MSNRLAAIQMVVRLVTITGMSLINACRASANYYQVDSDWLYRELTNI